MSDAPPPPGCRRRPAFRSAAPSAPVRIAEGTAPYLLLLAATA